MKSRKISDERVIKEASLSLEGLKHWLGDLIFDHGSTHFRVPDEVFGVWSGEVFDSYSKAEDEKVRRMILQKVLHTKEVMEAGIDISSEKGEFNWDIYQVNSVCLLHDLGRFGQALLGGYSDKKTNFDHAEAGAVIIESRDWRDIERLGLNKNVIVEAVRQHNKKVYKGNDEYAKLTRDADKLALLRYAPYFLREDVFPRAGVTKQVLDAHKIGEMVSTEHVKTLADVMIAWLAWESDLNFEETRRLCCEDGVMEWLKLELKRILGDGWNHRG